MNLFELQNVFNTDKKTLSLIKILNKYPNIFVKGLKGSSSSMLFAGLFTKSHDNFLFVLNDEESAAYFYNDLTNTLGYESVLYLPSAYKKNIKYGQVDASKELQRTDTLYRLQEPNKRFIIVSYPEGIAEKVITKEELSKSILTLRQDEEIDRDFVVEMLESYNLEMVDYVYEPGQYAMRGSILDVFSYSNENPYRIDFFGDEIASIRSFNVDDQLSIEKLTEIKIIPDIQKANKSRINILELLPPKTIVAFSDYRWVLQRIEDNFEGITILKNPEYLLDFRYRLTEAIDFKKLADKFNFIHFGQHAYENPNAVVEFSIDPQPLYHKNFDLLVDDLRLWIDKGYKIYILSDSSKQLQRLRNIFDDNYGGVDFTPIDNNLSSGFVDLNTKICVFTDHQIFDRFNKYKLKYENVRSGKFALSLKELQQFQVGDYIVHIDHGVGQFGGLIKSDLNGNTQELIKLTYLNGDEIFVSIHALHKISKYRGKDNVPPKVNKLGSGAWNKIKEKTKSKVKDIARDLIKLYAKRREEKGFEFSPDTFMQNELEASFIYEDTPDQIKTTNEVKKDMESELPMDRLICGDVGFGKTEIAIRAAFKAVTDNKQVAILVPTTVLAFQHFKTIKERLKNFPCTIDYLSRARTSKQTKEVLQNLKDGKIDIIIGTHKLVGKDVEFKDLGLMIVDEEQKFGVAVKEKLRQMKHNVDTLTLTATPIPRTLQFSLMGARDMSTLSTPPPNRHPIQTSIHMPDSQIIKEAVEFEMSRNGQVFIINNRIGNLPDIEAMVRKVVPKARLAVGHGQMEPSKLEEVIIGFMNHDFDVLIATSIIEAGIDIPNANTIIINNAQNFGLSDLHQLRGRVGRGNKKAFAYLLAPPLHTLSTEARRRLQAIENFAELGHGIHIAMQDLDIRGAGNMLGAEQSGFIADLGYEVYQRILTDAVSELKHEEFADIYYKKDENGKIDGDNFVTDVVVDSDLELLFESSYIVNESERITIYRELDKIEKEEDIQPFMNRLIDRFGEPSKEGKELIKVVSLRILAKKMGIEKIVLKRNIMNLYLVSNHESTYYQSTAFDKLLQYVANNANRCELKEKNNKRWVTISNVETVMEGYIILNNINAMEI